MVPDFSALALVIFALLGAVAGVALAYLIALVSPIGFTAAIPVGLVVGAICGCALAPE